MKNWRAVTIVIITVVCSQSFLDCSAQETSFSAEQLDGRTRILLDGELFTELVHDDDSPYGTIPRPFLFPIYGPTGASMTRSYPMLDQVEKESRDHPHHRSLWFAHPVNGVDFWAQGEGKGRVVADGEPTVSEDSTGLGITMNAKWIAADETELLIGRQVYGFKVQEDGSRVIDIQVELTPAEGVEQATFQDTKEGTMAIRTHPALRLVGDHASGHAFNSEGDTDRDLWGKRAKWVAYWGTIKDEICGVAIFDHPNNLRHPTWWHAREYGLVAANPFGIHDFERTREGLGDFELKQGETLNLKYRFVFFAGHATDKSIKKKYESWVEESNRIESKK